MNANGLRQVLLVDDHPIVRQGLRRLVENEDGLGVCGEAETASDARQLVREQHPDAVVVDLSLREGDGIDLVRDLRAHYPRLPILVLSMYDEIVLGPRLAAAGANGYVMKQAASAQFLDALKLVLHGGRWFSGAAQKGPARQADPVDALTRREFQVLKLIGRGLTTRQIAESVNLSIKTIEAHRQRVKRKLGLGCNADLVRFATDWTVRRV